MTLTTVSREHTTNKFDEVETGSTEEQPVKEIVERTEVYLPLPGSGEPLFKKLLCSKYLKKPAGKSTATCR